MLTANNVYYACYLISLAGLENQTIFIAININVG